MKLSVLDVLPVLSGSDAPAAIRRAVPLARLAEAEGYGRVWYAEHHGMTSIASAAPELMIAHVAPATTRIRVGAGGVMLPNHTPLQVVERYRTLEALHPGRVDLGIGRAAGTDPLTARALRSVAGDRVGGMIAELDAFAHGRFPADHPFARIEVTPGDVGLPPVWMLGSSGGSARLAGELGTGYAFAGHFSPTPAGPAVAAYRDAFRPSAAFPEPRVILALSVVCAEDGDEALRLASSVDVLFRRMRSGQVGPVPSPEEAAADGWTAERARSGSGPMGGILIHGTPAQVREAIEARAAAVDADEVMVMTIVHDPEARHRSHALVARAFGLPADGAGVGEPGVDVAGAGSPSP